MAGILRNFQSALKNVFLKIKKDVQLMRNPLPLQASITLALYMSEIC